MPAKTPKEGLQNMAKSFNPAAAAGWKCHITMDIVGDAKYNIKIENQKCVLADGPAPKPDLTITISKADWMAISNGQLNAVAAFMSGKLKSQGDMSHLMKLQSVFKLG
jgi:putative sterol carrier protein